MSRTRDSRPSESEVDHGRLKRTDVMFQAHRDYYAKGFVSVGLFLGARLDNSILANVLGDMDAESLQSLAVDAPDSHGTPSGETTDDRLDLAVTALKDISTILQGLCAAHRTGRYPRLQPLMDQCLEMMHERWGDVTNCIALLSGRVSSSGPEGIEVISNCISVLEPLLHQPEKNQFQQEILTMRATAEIAFHLVRLLDANTGRAITISPAQGSGCSIAKLLEVYAGSKAGAVSLSSHMESLPQSSRKEIVRAFVRRFHDVLLESQQGSELIHRDEATAIQTLRSLIKAACGLLTPMAAGDEYVHRRLIFEATSALSNWTKGASLGTRARIDPYIMNDCVNELCSVARVDGLSARVRERLFRGGIVSCLLHSLPYAVTGRHPWQGVRGQACDFIPFMADSRCFEAAKKAGTNLELFEELKDDRKSRNFQTIYDAYLLAYQCGKSTFKGGRKAAAQMCYNVKHKLPAHASGTSSALMTCGSCHAVFYCSKECQEEDWTSLHKAECRPATLTWRKKLKDGGITRRVEQDRLAFLEVLANRFLPPPSNYGSSRLVAVNQGSTPRVEDTQMHIFDAAGVRNDLDRANSLKFFKYEHMPISAFLKKYDEEVGESTIARIFQCAEDVMRHPESTSMVTGMFLAKPCVVITVCAKMQYMEGAEQGWKYRVVSHGCCVLTIRAPPNSTLGGV